MARNGLKNIMISIDDFHLEFIDISHIKNCAISAIHNNIGVTLQVVYSKNTRRIEALKKDLNLNLDDSRLSWVETPCDPIGRASVEIPYDEFLRNPFTERSFCSILKLLSVRLDGSIVPCCGSGAEAPGLVIGNIWQDTIDEIIDRANQSPVINLLTLDGGPLGLIERLKEHGIGKYAERRYTSPCDACFQIFSDQEVIAILDEILEQNWINYYAMRIGWQTKLIQHLRHVKDQMRIQ